MEIFYTDLTGDGTGGDLLPGTKLGAFGRSIKVGDLNNVINDYDSKTAGTLTPAGQALVSAGLFTSAQLQQLGAVAPIIATAPAGHVGLDNFVADDIRLSYPVHLGKLGHRFGEQFTLDPPSTSITLRTKLTSILRRDLSPVLSEECWMEPLVR